MKDMLIKFLGGFTQSEVADLMRLNEEKRHNHILRAYQDGRKDERLDQEPITNKT